MIDFDKIRNPILRLEDNLRDPAVFKTPDGYQLYFTRYCIGDWNAAENWSVATCFTKDFINFSGLRDITPKNFASPGDIVFWHGRWILPYQSYPVRPQELYFVESNDGMEWSAPQRFLPEALGLSWNTDQRAIDPSFVVQGDELHCFFVGSQGLGTPSRANLLGHAVSKDPKLQQWKVLSVEAPLMGRDRAADGVENVVIYRANNRWVMMLSEGMENQHLAMAQSEDLIAWEPLGAVAIETQPWSAFRYGAPFVWEEDGGYLMLLMGEESPDHRSTLGLLRSADGIQWEVLPSR